MSPQTTPAEDDGTSKRRRIWLALAAVAAVVAFCPNPLVSRKTSYVGGRWFLQTETSNLPESTYPHGFLHRRRLIGTKRIAEVTFARYIGDNCVLYVSKGLYAACDSHEPIELARANNSWTLPEGSDTVSISGHAITIADIKRRAQR